MQRTSWSRTGIYIQGCWQLRTGWMAPAMDAQGCGQRRARAAPDTGLRPDSPLLSALVLPSGAPRRYFPYRPETPCPACRRDRNFKQTCTQIVIFGGDSVKAHGFSSFALSFEWKLALKVRFVCCKRGRSIHTNFWKLKFQICSAPEHSLFGSQGAGA